MSLMDLRLIRGRGMRACRQAAPWSTLQLDWLESRVAPATVTFAQFAPLGGSPQVFAYTNNNGTSADFSTVPGGDPILLSFDPRFAPGLTSPRAAHLFLTSH